MDMSRRDLTKTLQLSNYVVAVMYDGSLEVIKDRRTGYTGRETIEGVLNSIYDAIELGEGRKGDA